MAQAAKAHSQSCVEKNAKWWASSIPAMIASAIGTRGYLRISLL